MQIDAISAKPVPAGQPLRLRIVLSLRDPRPRHGRELQVGDRQAWTDLPAQGRGGGELDVPSERGGGGGQEGKSWKKKGKKTP